VNTVGSGAEPMWTQFKRPERTNRFQKTLDREAEERFERIMRERGQMPPDNYPLFRDPPVYVVLLATEPNGRSTEFAIERMPECEAVLCFLSPVDAAIEGELRATPGLGYQVWPASRTPERYFRTADGDLTLMLHLAWLALDGRLLVRDSGIPCRLWRALFADGQAGMPARFEVDAPALDEVDYLYECAGLYAWEETHRRAEWQADVVGRAAVRTSDLLVGPVGPDRSRAELALFDPEAMRWHHLSQQVLAV
jgi:hypothetical protein